MRQGEGKNQRDFSNEGINAGFVGLGCSNKRKFNPARLSGSDIDRIESENPWSKGQIRRFVKTMSDGDLVLLSREKGNRFLAVGILEGDAPFPKWGQSLPLRRRVVWRIDRYPRDYLLGYGYFGLQSLARKEELDSYAGTILEGKRIRFPIIWLSQEGRLRAALKVRERFEALLPSYFEDLVRFLAERMGLQVDYFAPTKSNDAGLDLRGWRLRDLFRGSASAEHFSLQVKRRAVSINDIDQLKKNLQRDEIGVLITSMDVNGNEKLMEASRKAGIRLIGSSELAEYVLDFHKKLPEHLDDVFRITEEA